jgi:TonB family protein
LPDTPKPPERRSANTIENVLAYSKRFLLYGFGISILLHLVFGPFVEWRHSTQEKQEVEKVTLTKKVTKVVTPRPTPKPTPTPTPTPKPTPTPTPPPKTPPPQTPPPKQVRLKVNVPKQTSKSVSGQSSEQQYNVKTGSQQGVPQGVLASGPPATPAPTATTAPTATAAACANPNRVATATQKVTPIMPEIARQMGATGTAQIKVTLDANGNVTAVTVFKSTNNKALDQAALQAAQQSKYSPEFHNCQPVGGSYLYTVTFESQ